MTTHLKSIPFLKIIIPFIAGIILFLCYGDFTYAHLLFIVTSILWLISFIVQKIGTPQKTKKIAYIILTNALLFTIAIEVCIIHNARSNKNHYSNYISSTSQKIFATVNNIPTRGKKSTKIPIQVDYIEHQKQWHYCFGNSYIYLNDSTYTPSIGSTLYLEANFNTINEPKNPNEFNYKEYLNHQNIFYTIYCSDSILKDIPQLNRSFSLLQIGVVIKSKIITILRESKLSKDAFAICAALLVGYDDEIDNDVLQSFSHSGTLHILSVSGMHTGILYGILIWFLSLFDKHKQYLKLRFFTIVGFLLLFVLITGISPSVLRASLMLALMLFGQTFYKKGNSYNTLLFSAFLILLFNPFLIVNIGFLLSYLAVFGIIYLYPRLYKTYTFNNKFLQLVWSSVLISISATLFTLPISLFYFHQFPIWFIVSNLIVIPISTLLLIATIIFLIFHPFAIVKTLIVWVMNSGTDLMLWFVKLTDNPVYGFIDYIPFSVIDLIFFSLLIAFILYAFHFKNYKSLILCGYLSILWLSSSILTNYQQIQEDELIVFHIKRKSAYAVRAGQTVYTSFNNISSNEFQRYIKPYLQTISHLNLINVSQGVIANQHSIIANNSIIKNDPTQKSLIMIVSNNVFPDIQPYCFQHTTIIADCSNNYTFVKKLKQYCYKYNVQFYSLYEEGSVKLKL